jgi:hypothetical protein
MLFILTSMKDLTIFVHINKFGVVFALINTCFIVGVGIYAMMDQKFNYTIVKKRDQKPSKKNDVWNVQLALFGTNIAPIMGILGGGFYLHNISLNIYRNSRRPEKAVRDIWLGYTCVCLSYMVCGTIGALGFQNPHLFEYLVKNNFVVAGNCLLMFNTKNVLATIIRLIIFL